MFTTQFWKDAAERAVATFAQALIAALGVDFAFNDGNAFKQALLVSLFAAVLSVLKSLAASHVGDPNTASLVSSREIASEEEVPQVFPGGDEDYDPDLIWDDEPDDDELEDSDPTVVPGADAAQEEE